MKTTFDVINRVFALVNTGTITALIPGGRIYRRKLPLNAAGKNIEIVTQPIDNAEGDDVQRCAAYVNTFAPNLDNGQPDEIFFASSDAAILAALTVYAGSSTSYFELVAVPENIYSDYDNPKRSYSAIRVECTIQK